MNTENYIESQYREIILYENIEYIDLYENIKHEKLKKIFSTLHHNYISLFKSMNSRLPTKENIAHFWADSIQVES